LHRTSTRTRRWPTLAALAFDHRRQLEDLAVRHGVPIERIAAFKLLMVQAAQRGYDSARHALAHDAVLPAPGVIIDDRHGADALARVTGKGWWIGRPVERPGSRPLVFEAGDSVGQALRAWPAEHVVKCLVAHHPEDGELIATAQLDRLAHLARACSATGHELLVEVIPPVEMHSDNQTLAKAMRQIYARGVRPDWWKLQSPPDSAAWQQISTAIEQHDPHCRGVLLLGLEASEASLAQAFRMAAGQRWCKGFAVGRSLFAKAAEGWFAGALSDEDAITDVAQRYHRLIHLWCEATASSSAAGSPLLTTTTT
jgi:5-dehydro-2-deoxygluconokinase